MTAVASYDNEIGMILSVSVDAVCGVAAEHNMTAEPKRLAKAGKPTLHLLLCCSVQRFGGWEIP